MRDYEGVDAAISLPTVVDRTGAARVLRLQLDPVEATALRRSAELLREMRETAREG